MQPTPVAIPTLSQPRAAPSLEQSEFDILCFLSESDPVLKLQVDIETGAGESMSHGKAGKLLNRLEELEYVHRPKGSRKGYGITIAGKAALQSKPKTPVAS